MDSNKKGLGYGLGAVKVGTSLGGKKYPESKVINNMLKHWTRSERLNRLRK